MREEWRRWEVRVIEGGDGNELGPPELAGGRAVGLNLSSQNHRKDSEDQASSEIAK